MTTAPLAEPVQARTLPNQVAAHLVRRIASVGFDDDALPSEAEIAAEFGVSRTVARESLRMLASLDMVHIAQGRRISVRPQAEWDYLSPLLLEWLPSDQVDGLLRELHDVRLLVEPELAATAASVMNDGNLADIGAELLRMGDLQDQPEAYLQADQTFHLKICEAADNRILDRIMYSSRWLLEASRRVTNQLPGSLGCATEQHQAIYEALVARDPERAREAMRDHVRSNAAAWTAERGGKDSVGRASRRKTRNAPTKTKGRAGS